MNRFNEIIYNIISVLFLLLIPLKTLSQTDTKISKTDPGSSGSRDSTHSLFAGLGYGNNFIYLGSTISQNQPYGYSSLTYGYKDELFATVSAVHLSDLTPFMAFYTGSINYSHVFNSWFDISTGISRYQISGSLADNLFNSFFYADLALGLDWKLIYTKISAGVLFSDETSGYLQIRNSRYFQTHEFTKKKAYFSFDPYFSLLCGSLTEIKTTKAIL